MNLLFGRRNPAASAKEVDAKILSTEEMAVQCLNFYLEPYVEQLLAGKYSENFKVDVFVKEVASLFLQHQQLSIKRSIPIHHRVKDILKVKCFEDTGELLIPVLPHRFTKCILILCIVYSSVQMYVHVSLIAGNEKMA